MGDNETRCGPGLRCFGPLECETCGEEKEPEYDYQMCVHKCDYDAPMIATRGKYKDQSFVNRYTSSTCSYKSDFPMAIVNPDK